MINNITNFHHTQIPSLRRLNVLSEFRLLPLCMAGLFDHLKKLVPMNGDSEDIGKRALVSGSVAAGAIVTGALLRAFRKRDLRIRDLPPALDADVYDMEIMEGRYRFYAREGKGVPIVLLHSVNAAASSMEMRPIFDFLCQTTPRPVFAVDWIGFGLSDRPPVAYRPPIFQRQLRRFLSERIHQPADVVAYSLGSEIAAITARSHPFLFRRMVLVCPTALDDPEPTSPFRSTLLRATNRSGAFEVGYRRLTRPHALRRFYQKYLFDSADRVPDELIEYAQLTSEVRGAHHAPANFVSGDLFSTGAAREAYATTVIPTLVIVPKRFRSSIQSFERLDEIERQNPEHIRVYRSSGGLMPQFEDASATLEAIAIHLR